ncbi:hypothetical protein [Herbiconiux ginsengi]|uniref:Uncharacterized protein n=1 Tax=Herbiconiux ginsengi TaxID=381665 RepID=A0A1H3SP43_9MICO|nr:hypothetical protein [Herbiconiux ginsengi]SDZ39490.1 hypothetical protein SAMN05216554_3524 [Herbiconiux ginsengi]
MTDLMPARPKSRAQLVTSAIVSIILVLGACTAWTAAVITHEQQTIATHRQQAPLKEAS